MELKTALGIVIAAVLLVLLFIALNPSSTGQAFTGPPGTPSAFLDSACAPADWPTCSCNGAKCTSAKGYSICENAQGQETGRCTVVYESDGRTPKGCNCTISNPA